MHNQQSDELFTDESAEAAGTRTRAGRARLIGADV